MRRRSFVTLTAAGVGTLLAGCGRDEPTGIDLQNAPKGPIVLGFSQVGAEGGWRRANTASIRKAAERNRIDLNFKDAEGDPAKQIADVHAFIDAKVSVIAFAPVVETGWGEVLRRARGAGIPVVLTDRLIDEKDTSLWASSIGAEFASEGNLAAIYLENDYAGTSGTVNVVEILGVTGATPTKLRAQGFAATAAKTGRLKIIDEETGDWTKDGGESAMRRLLRRNKRIDAVFAQNDDMGLGAVIALEAAGKKPGTAPKIVTVDGTKAALQGLVDRKLTFVVECSPEIGEPLMSVVVDLFHGGRVPKRIESDKAVFDMETAGDALLDRTY
ncbi:ABC transporter substrate-binding protein [Actinoplanes xinjiangensis]|jgi:ABC-type sugar transport system substrate-binding protein|uniref:Monosaccharide ABC transporter substrate-binding protein (CUT2 family) n=1 Tax=Actinoplanes xinjiangensis TaxID=512350 RepID=A0A316EGI8_9ACTN|nr:ABC transporter substrate-binding protein [Actinoplanes xinjiangensis]PWK30042.1 monosaccharide ABC transporter substrate-binding protein (CUT2 family) [Actinoplanes xinjiangensis]GIF44684.1 LacI family transcriptional regulator [Actinoplanes xinjiangensis]